VLAPIPGVTALRTRRAIADYGRVLTEQRARYDVRHDLVDAAP